MLTRIFLSLLIPIFSHVFVYSNIYSTYLCIHIYKCKVKRHHVCKFEVDVCTGSILHIWNRLNTYFPLIVDIHQYRSTDRQRHKKQIINVQIIHEFNSNSTVLENNFISRMPGLLINARKGSLWATHLRYVYPSCQWLHVIHAEF